LLTWWSGAPQRWGLKRFDQSFLGFCFNRPPVVEDKSLHASESFFRLVRSFAPVPTDMPQQTPLVVPSAALRWATETLPLSPFAVLFVDAPVPERIWPLERFAVVGEHITKAHGCTVVVVGRSSNLLESRAEGIRMLSDLSIPNLTALISRAKI